MSIHHTVRSSVCVCVCVCTLECVFICIHMHVMWQGWTHLHSNPVRWAQQETQLTHSPHTHTHSARHQPPSPQSCHANHLNSTIKANKMFHVGRKSRGKWLSVFVNVTELKGTLILIFSPVSSDSWFSQQSCKKITAAMNKSFKRERERPL